MTSPKNEYETNKAKREHRAKEKKYRFWYREPEPVARFTKWVAGFTLALAVVAGLQTCILSNQLGEMRDEQRPWISSSVLPDGDITAVSTVGIQLPLKFEAKNPGKTPAMHVLAHAIIFGLEDGLLSDQFDKSQKPICAAQSPRSSHGDSGMDYTIFPNDCRSLLPPPLFWAAPWRNGGQKLGNYLPFRILQSALIIGPSAERNTELRICSGSLATSLAASISTPFPFQKIRST